MRRRAAQPLIVTALAIPVLALTLGLAACSGGSAPAARNTGSATQSYEQAFDDYTLDLAACMREAGFDVEDPEPGNAITLEGTDAESVAYDACAAELGAPPVDPNQPSRAEISEELRERAECLRGKGFDVPDPAADGSWDLPEDLFDEARACAV